MIACLIDVYCTSKAFRGENASFIVTEAFNGRGDKDKKVRCGTEPRSSALDARDLSIHSKTIVTK